MGSVGRRPNGRWRARYRDSDGREHARHFVEKDEAQRWLEAITASIGTRSVRSHPGPAGSLFASYAEQWRSIRLHRATSTAHVETMLRRHVYPTLGSRRIGTIVHSDIQGWVRIAERRERPGCVYRPRGPRHRLVHLPRGDPRPTTRDEPVRRNTAPHTRTPTRRAATNRAGRPAPSRGSRTNCVHS